MHFAKAASAACLACLLSTVRPAGAVAVASPNGGLSIDVTANSAGRLVYSVSFKGRTVVEESNLGVTVGGVDLGAGVTLGEPVRSAFNETYKVLGVKATGTNHYNNAVIPVSRGGQSYSLEARAFDDGVAFRYVVPGSGSRTVGGEATSFRIPAGSRVWYQTRTARNDYEAHFFSADAASLPTASGNASTLMAVVTYELAGGAGYVALTEAYLRNYNGLYYAHRGNRTLQALFPEASWTLQGAFESPWRVILVAPDLNTLVNTDVIRALNPPPAPALANADWITPGLAVWNYLGNFSQGNSMDLQQRYCRQAGQMGIPLNTVDAGFGGNLQQLAAYCKEQGSGVKVLIWRRWNTLTDRTTRRAWFQQLQSWGVVGAKIDFIEGETKDKIDFYEETTKDAAEFKVQLIYHGSNKPTGQERTYPNYISSEAIHGLEHQRLRVSDEINTIHPFTRMLAGPADYTPLQFNPVPREGRMGRTSGAQQIGTVITYTTLIQNLSEDPAKLVAHPAIRYIASIPTAWDETVVLPQSKIGDLVAMARRKGDTWFVAVYSGTGQARTVTLPLSFLRGSEFNATLIADRMDSQAEMTLTERTARASETLTLQLRPYGGWTGRFTAPGGVWINTDLSAVRPGVRLTQAGRNVSLAFPGNAGATLRLVAADGRTLWTRRVAGSALDFALPGGGVHWLRVESAAGESVSRLAAP